jgi:hypothetical protein
MGVRLKKRPKSVRYISQRNRYSCGPIAILNIMKWAGYDVTYKYLGTLKKYCGTTRQGTKESGLVSGLNKFQLLVTKYYSRVTAKVLESYINSGYVAILLISKWNNDNIPERHYLSIVGKQVKYTNIFYKVINYGPEGTVVWVSRKKLIRLFNRSLKGQRHPKAWFIRRRDRQ